MLNDFGKLLVLVFALIGITVLGALELAAETSVVGVYAMVIGYVTGNGVLAKRRKSPSPLITPKEGVIDNDEES